jgi:hypothetical protein
MLQLVPVVVRAEQVQDLDFQLLAVVAVAMEDQELLKQI